MNRSVGEDPRDPASLIIDVDRSLVCKNTAVRRVVEASRESYCLTISGPSQ